MHPAWRQGSTKTTLVPDTCTLRGGKGWPFKTLMVDFEPKTNSGDLLIRAPIAKLVVVVLGIGEDTSLRRPEQRQLVGIVDETNVVPVDLSADSPIAAVVSRRGGTGVMKMLAANLGHLLPPMRRHLLQADDVCHLN